MLSKPSANIQECYRHAEVCARKAEQHRNDRDLHADYLAMERRWIGLAHSYEFAERLGDFTKAPKP